MNKNITNQPILIRKVGFKMKKIIILLSIISIIFIMTNKESEYVIIPKDSIRFRIIPNSNTVNDLYMKELVKEEITSVINEIETSKNITETREKIMSSYPKIKYKISELFKENNYNETFEINYGTNYFPEKIYKGVKYPEGNYESMVIKIGVASGDNYWCVLFPPLCMMEAKETDKVEYKFFIEEIINKYIKNK